MKRPTSFSYPEEEQNTWDKFKRIARREGKTANVLIWSFITEYVDIHDPGNPQLRITSFSPNGEKTIEQAIGRIRQQCLEYAKKHGELNFRFIEELMKDAKIRGPTFQPIRDRIAKWLSDQEVKVWR